MDDYIVCDQMCLPVLLRGLLTGKFSREKAPSASESRIGYVHQNEAMALQGAPAWSQYKDNENYWKLIDAMKDIAEKQGNLFLAGRNLYLYSPQCT